MLIPCKACQSTFQLDRSLVKPTGSRVRCSKCHEVFRIYPPEPTDRRNFPRVKIRNLISYFSFNEKGNFISQGIGIALDISKGGMLLETPSNIESGLLLLAATDRENNLIEIKGNLIYSIKADFGTYHSGIELIGKDGEVIKFITNLIREYNYRGYNLYLAIARRIQRSYIDRTISG